MNDIKICSKCRKMKSFNEFSKRKDGTCGLQYICKACNKIMQKRWRVVYKDSIKKRLHEYYLKNKDKVTQKFKEYVSNNPLKRKEICKRYFNKNKNKVNKYNKNRRTYDLNFKLKGNLRNRLHWVLHTKDITGSAVSDLGCSVDEFRSYIESKFDKDMSWDNYGVYGWHLDHIKPLSSFDLTNIDQFRIAAHYTNYQPLWAEDNYKKGNTINTSDNIQ